MTALARNPLEERRMRAMSYLLDPAHDASVLKSGASAGASGTASDGDTAGRESLLTMVRTLRKGQGAVARRLAERDEAEAAFLAHGRGLTQKEFIAICRKTQVPPEDLARLIRLELALSGAPPADDKPKTDKRSSWTESIAVGDTKPAKPLSLETLTEFDPTQSVYRDGRWIAP
jgi:hypothetical protein